MFSVFEPLSFGYEIKAFCCSSYFDWPYLQLYELFINGENEPVFYKQ